MNKIIKILLIFACTIQFGCASHTLPPDHICRNPRKRSEIQAQQLQKIESQYKSIDHNYRNMDQGYDMSDPISPDLPYFHYAHSPRHHSSNSGGWDSDAAKAILVFLIVIVVITAINEHNNEVAKARECARLLELTSHTDEASQESSGLIPSRATGF